METIIVLWALGYALSGALSQAATDGRAAIRSAGKAAGTAMSRKAARIRKDGGRISRTGLAAGTGLGVLASGLWRAGAGTGRSLVSGGRRGWVRGRTKARLRAKRGAARRARRRYERETPPSLVDLTKQPRPTPEPMSTADPGSTPRPTPQPVGGDGSASSTDPDNPTPSTPPDRETPTPSSTKGADDMTFTAAGDVATVGQARRQITAFIAAATTFLDTADQARADAATARAEAAALQAAAEQMAAGLAGNEFDAATLGEIAAMQEQAAGLLAAAERLEAAAADVGQASDGLNAASASALTGLNARHAGLDEAHKSAPVRAAKREGYEGD